MRFTKPNLSIPSCSLCWLIIVIIIIHVKTHHLIIVTDTPGAIAKKIKEITNILAVKSHIYTKIFFKKNRGATHLLDIPMGLALTFQQLSL